MANNFKVFRWGMFLMCGVNQNLSKKTHRDEPIISDSPMTNGEGQGHYLPLIGSYFTTEYSTHKFDMDNYI